MLAQHDQELDNAGGINNQLPHAKKDKQSTSFMFIDASNGGVNAKPDKNVRSFVMKNARHKKIWSTKPKILTEASLGEGRRRRRSPSRSQASKSQSLSIGPLPRLEYDAHTALREAQIIASPCSSRCSSVCSGQSSKWSGQSPVPCHASLRARYDHVDSASKLRNSRLKALARQSSFHIGFTESFNCLPVILNAYDKSLLHQFITAIAPRLLPLDLYKSSGAAAIDWVAKSIQSPNGAPFIYAALTTMSRAVNLDPNIYKWRAISDLNRFLADPSRSTDDANIAAVLILLSLEEAELADPRKTGDERKYSISVNDAHRKGLQTMIGQRGGLSALGGNQCLQVFILMHSVAQSIATFRRPYAIICDDDGRVEDYTSISFQPARSLSHILRQFHDLEINHSLFNIVSSIAVLNSDLSSWYETGTTLVSPLNLQKHACLLIYRLFRWCDQHPESEETNISLDRSVCLALVVFMVNISEPHSPSYGSRLSKVVTKLYKSLQNVPVSRWSASPSLLLWTMTIGAIGAKSLPKILRSLDAEPIITFFARYCRPVFETTTDENLLENMKTCLWIPSIFDDRAKIEWSSMGLCKANGPDLDESSTGNEEEEWEQVVDDEYALGQSTATRFFAEKETKK